MASKTKNSQVSKLIALVDNLRRGVSHHNVTAEVILENMGLSASVLGDDKSAEEVLENLTTADKSLNKLLTAYTRYNKVQDKLDKLTKQHDEVTAKQGRGALSPNQVWGASGWKLGPHGFAWHRPPNVKSREHFQTQSFTHIAKYDETLPPGEGSIYPLAIYDELFARKQSALQYAKHLKDIRRANAVWTGVTMSPVGFSLGGRNYTPWTDWQKKVFDFASAHGLGTGKTGLATATFLLKKIAEDKGKKQITQHHADLNYQRYLIDMTPRERERHALIMKYGGGAEGIALADYEISKTRGEKAESLRRRRRLDASKEEQEYRKAYRYDMMDEFDQRMENLVERYGGDKAKAESSLRNQLKKELPPFFKNSKLSTKTLFNINKGLNSAPFKLGKLARHPYAAIAAAGLALTHHILSQSNAANKSTVSWENARLYHGKTDPSFLRAALLAGISDPGEINKLYGKLSMQFGTSANAINILRNIAGVASGMSDDQRRHILAGYGLSENEYAIALGLANKLSISEDRATAANMANIDIQKTMGYRTGSGTSATMKSLMLDIPFMQDTLARSGGIGSTTTTTNTSNTASTAIYVGELNVRANDPKQLSEELKRETSIKNTSTLRAFGGKGK